MLKKYYHLTKPERTLTNVLTAGAGYLFASAWHIAWQPLLAILIGSSLIIASACVLNNLIDRDLDRNMKRTKKRALVTGQISAQTALAFAIALGVLGFWTLAYTNWLTLGIGIVAFIGYVVLYDVAKRVSEYGTLVGTIPGGASLVAGYTTVTDHVDTAALLLFLIMAAWQMAHFYAIAIYRFEDYRAAKVPVWPVRFGIKNTKYQIVGWVAVFVLACASLSAFGYAGWTFLVVMTMSGLYWLWHGAQGLMEQKIDDTKWARGMFGQSLIVVMVLSVMIALGSVLA